MMIKQEFPGGRVRYRPTSAMDYIFWWGPGPEVPSTRVDNTRKCVWINIGSGGLNLIGGIHD